MSINYALMNRLYPKQKAALTRAINAKDPVKVLEACWKAVNEWDQVGAWPDGWHRWNIALGDAIGWNPDLTALANMSNGEYAALKRSISEKETD